MRITRRAALGENGASRIMYACEKPIIAVTIGIETVSHHISPEAFNFPNVYTRSNISIKARLQAWVLEAKSFPDMSLIREFSVESRRPPALNSAPSAIVISATTPQAVKSKSKVIAEMIIDRNVSFNKPVEDTCGN